MLNFELVGCADFELFNFELRIQESKFIIAEGNQLKTQNSKLKIQNST